MLRLTVLAITTLLTLAPSITTANKSQVRYMQEVLNHTTSEEKMNLTKVLDQIDAEPLKKKHKGQTVYRIQYVEKDSPFERAGFKRGDLVVNGFKPFVK